MFGPLAYHAETSTHFAYDAEHGRHAPAQILAIRLPGEPRESLLELEARAEQIDIRQHVYGPAGWSEAGVVATGLDESLLELAVVPRTDPDDGRTTLFFSRREAGLLEVEVYEVRSDLSLAPLPLEPIRPYLRIHAPTVVERRSGPDLTFASSARPSHTSDGYTHVSVQEARAAGEADQEHVFDRFQCVSDPWKEKYKKFQFPLLVADFDGSGGPEALFHFRRPCSGLAASIFGCPDDDRIYFWRAMEDGTTRESRIDWSTEREPLVAANVFGDDAAELLSVRAIDDDWASIRTARLVDGEADAWHEASERRSSRLRELVDRPHHVADLDGDGKSDLLFTKCECSGDDGSCELELVAWHPTEPDQWIEGEAFASAVGRVLCGPTTRSVVADVDGDGRLDLTLIHDQQPRSFLNAPGGWAAGR